MWSCTCRCYFSFLQCLVRRLCARRVNNCNRAEFMKIFNKAFDPSSVSSEPKAFSRYLSLDSTFIWHLTSFITSHHHSVVWGLATCDGAKHRTDNSLQRSHTSKLECPRSSSSRTQTLYRPTLSSINKWGALKTAFNFCLNVALLRILTRWLLLYLFQKYSCEARFVHLSTLRSQDVLNV